MLLDSALSSKLERTSFSICSKVDTEAMNFMSSTLQFYTWHLWNSFDLAVLPDTCNLPQISQIVDSRKTMKQDFSLSSNQQCHTPHICWLAHDPPVIKSVDPTLACSFIQYVVSHGIETSVASQVLKIYGLPLEVFRSNSGGYKITQFLMRYFRNWTGRSERKLCPN